MKNFKAYLKEGIMSQYPELGPATGVSQDQVKADQKRTDRAKEWNRKETERQERNVPSPSAKVPSPDEGPVSKKLKEEEQLDEKLIRVRNARSGAIRSVSSAFRKIYKKQGWNAVQGTRG